MKLENSIVVYATKEAKEKRKEPKQKKRTSCPSCEIREIKKDDLFDVEIKYDYINKEIKE
jgi:hypothetical protein